MEKHSAERRSNHRLWHAVAAIVFAITGIVNDEPLACVLAAFFGVQALFNMAQLGVATNVQDPPNPTGGKDPGPTRHAKRPPIMAHSAYERAREMAEA